MGDFYYTHLADALVKRGLATAITFHDNNSMSTEFLPSQTFAQNDEL